MSLLAENVQDLTDTVTRMDTRVSSMESRVDGMDRRLIRVEATMVTKSYLDDKLIDLKGDLVKFVREEDAKVIAKLQ